MMDHETTGYGEGDTTVENKDKAGNPKNDTTGKGKEKTEKLGKPKLEKMICGWGEKYKYNPADIRITEVMYLSLGDDRARLA